ncbi:MAG TPA: hypothetical protein VNT99_07435 [Methylomirabilota bacterium]|nr:hypothetical protein [Methylomirabilota bacterium]
MKKTEVRSELRDQNGPAALILDLSPLRAPRIRTASESGTAFSFSWEALPGCAYQVQFKTDLNQTKWTNLGMPSTLWECSCAS